MKFIPLLLAIQILSSCSQFKGERTPAKAIDTYSSTQILEVISMNDQVYEQGLLGFKREYDKKWDSLKEWERIISSKGSDEEKELLQQMSEWEKSRDLYLDELKERIAAEPEILDKYFSQDGIHRKSFTINSSALNIKITSKLFIENLENLILGSDGNPVWFHPIENFNYQAKLEIINKSSQKLTARVICPQEIKLGKKTGKEIDFKLNKSDKINFPQGSQDCKLLLKSEKSLSWTHGINIVTESSINSDLALGKAIHETCLYQKNEQERFVTPYDFFTNISGSSMSCIHATEEARLLSDPVKSFQEKMKVLTGSYLPLDVFETKNIHHKMNFSHAPKLDTILMSYLEFKADFSGHMIGQALKFHADRGASIRIIVPSGPVHSFLAKRDEALLLKLTAYNPNIQFQKLVHKRRGKSFLNDFHRTLHTKILVTLSKSDPKANVVIEGGRNIKDTFLFAKTPDYSNNPTMTQYGTEEKYTFMDDLEVIIRSRSVAKQVAAQVLSLYYRDTDTMKVDKNSYHLDVIPSNSKSVPSKQLSKKTYARHFVSIPYVDGMEMEDFFVEMINSAQKSVHIVSPYVKPRKRLADAFLKAVDRGVKITLVTALTLEGDNILPSITEGIYRSFANKFYENINIYSWKGNPEVGNSMVHTKAILVDEELLYIGGVNLNTRSFKHDIESGFILSGSEIAQDFLKTYNNEYVKHSELMNEKQSVSGFSKIVKKVLGSFF